MDKAPPCWIILSPWYILSFCFSSTTYSFVSAPSNVTVSQINSTTGATKAFQCNFTNNFPYVTEERYNVDGTDITKSYILTSADHGKNLSCEAVSKYTDATGNKSESDLKEIIVYFSPENASLSEDSVTIELNVSRNLNFSYIANPEEGNITRNFTRLGAENGYTEGFLYWVNELDTGVQHVNVFVVNLTSTDDYGVYDVCAATLNPPGQACSRLNISNTMSTTLETPDVTELYQSTIGKNQEQQTSGIGIIVGAVLGGLVALLAIIAAIYFVRRKNDVVKEERINEIYDTSPNPGPGIEAVYAASGETSQREMTTNVAYEASPHGPEVQDVYTTVQRDKKGNAHTEKPSEDKSSPASTSVEQNGPVINDVYAVVKK